MILTVTDDLDLCRIAESGQCFRWEALGDGIYRIPHAGHCLRIAALGGGRFDLDCTGEALTAVWRPYLDLDEDYAAIRRRIRKDRDPYLFAAAQAEQGIRILRQEPWEALISFIISQNKNIPGIRTSIEKLCALAGEEKRDRAGQPFFTFPSPEAVAALSEAELRGCALGYRAEYVLATARAGAEGRLDPEKLARIPEEEAIEELMGLRGVGRKVASCAVLFGLHRLNAFPKDVWIRRILEREYPAGYPFADYAPYNGVMQQYMFAYERHRNQAV